jgi:hypothetical protein
MDSPQQAPRVSPRALRAFAIAPPVTALVYIITVTPDASNVFVSARTIGPQFALVVAALRFYLVLGVVLAAVGLPLRALGAYRLWPLLGGTLALGAAIYIGLPLALAPGLAGDHLPRFLAANLLVLAHITGMVAFYWWLRR